MFRQSVSSVVICIPVRYIHDHVGIAHLDDYHHAIELVIKPIKKLDVNIVNALKDNH